MKALGMTASELAEQMNQVLLIKTGRMGELTDRTIRRFLGGQTRWPQSRQRLALRHVFGCTADQLGFLNPSVSRRSEDPVHRRSFLAGSAAVATIPVIAGTSGGRVGKPEVAQLREALNGLIASENRDGGSQSLEIAALSHGQRAIDLVQNGRTASNTIRCAAYSLAAEAVTTAAWSAIETGSYPRARQHLERSLALAGLAADSAAVVQAWNGLAVLSQRCSRFADATAAADAARSTGIARRDPLFTSLAHARAAVAHSTAVDSRRALRSFDLATSALDRSKDQERPAWIFFYDAAELDGLSASVFLNLGRYADAEYHAHRTLSRLKPELQRNRALYTALLGLAQIQQGELEQACATVDPLFTTGLPASERIRDMLREFRKHAAATGSANARRWLNDTAVQI